MLSREESNPLFPVFLKLETLSLLLVGGGNVGLEKLEAILRNSPAAMVTVVADRFLPDLIELAARHGRVRLIERKFRDSDLDDCDLVILATDDRLLHEHIRTLCKQRRLLVNVADTPALCDFYLGSVVNKGSVKIGISTNGKSPTIAKRLREMLEAAIPDNTEELLNNMQQIRARITGDFAEKVRVLNEVTTSWLKKND